MKKYLDSLGINYQIKFEGELNPVIEKLQSFSALEPGWQFGEGEKINISTINKAIDLLLFGIKNGMQADVFPLIDGGINLFLYNDGDALSLIINPNLKIDLTYESGIGQKFEILGEEEDVDYSDIYNYMNEIREKCFLLDSFQSNITTIERSSDSTVLHFETHPVTVESLSLNWIVPLRRMKGLYADTSENITTESLVIQ